MNDKPADSALTFLSEKQVAALLTYEDLIACMAQALIAFSGGQVRQPVREMLEVEADQRYFASMPAVMPDAMGAKLVSFYPKNAQAGLHTHFAMIILLDLENGMPLAAMDGRLITQMRTAATSAAVSRVAADPESRSLALIGSGVQANAHLCALKTVFPIDDVRVWSRTPENAKSFATKNNARAMDIQDAVAGADIIVCATNAREPVLQGRWLKPGAHVNSVGSPRPDWRELDDALMSETLIVDARDAAERESGDVILSGATIFAEAGEILNARKRIDPSQTSVFKSVGIAAEDVAAARLVLSKYRQRQALE